MNELLRKTAMTLSTVVLMLVSMSAAASAETEYSWNFDDNKQPAEFSSDRLFYGDMAVPITKFDSQLEIGKNSDLQLDTNEYRYLRIRMKNPIPAENTYPGFAIVLKDANNTTLNAKEYSTDYYKNDIMFGDTKYRDYIFELTAVETTVKWIGIQPARKTNTRGTVYIDEIELLKELPAQLSYNFDSLSAKPKTMNNAWTIEDNSFKFVNAEGNTALNIGLPSVSLNFDKSQYKYIKVLMKNTAPSGYFAVSLKKSGVDTSMASKAYTSDFWGNEISGNDTEYKQYVFDISDLKDKDGNEVGNTVGWLQLRFSSTPKNGATAYIRSIEISDNPYYDISVNNNLEIRSYELNNNIISTESKYYVKDPWSSSLESYQIKYIAALFDESGNLKNVKTADASFTPGTSKEVVKTDIDISDFERKESDYIKVFAFDDNLLPHTNLTGISN